MSPPRFQHCSSCTSIHVSSSAFAKAPGSAEIEPHSRSKLVLFDVLPVQTIKPSMYNVNVDFVRGSNTMILLLCRRPPNHNDHAIHFNILLTFNFHLCHAILGQARKLLVANTKSTTDFPEYPFIFITQYDPMVKSPRTLCQNCRRCRVRVLLYMTDFVIVLAVFSKLTA